MSRMRVVSLGGSVWVPLIDPGPEAIAAGRTPPSGSGTSSGSGLEGDDPRTSDGRNDGVDAEICSDVEDEILGTDERSHEGEFRLVVTNRDPCASEMAPGGTPETFAIGELGDGTSTRKPAPELPGTESSESAETVTPGQGVGSGPHQHPPRKARLASQPVQPRGRPGLAERMEPVERSSEQVMPLALR